MAERFCFTFRLVPGREEEYQRRHDAIWPDLVEAIRDAGIGNYTLFRRGRQVIAYCECDPDAETAFERLARTDVNRRWGKSFDQIIEALTDERGELLAAAEVWHLE